MLLNLTSLDSTLTSLFVFVCAGRVSHSNLNSHTQAQKHAATRKLQFQLPAVMNKLESLFIAIDICFPGYIFFRCHAAGTRLKSTPRCTDKPRVRHFFLFLCWSLKNMSHKWLRPGRCQNGGTLPSRVGGSKTCI